MRAAAEPTGSRAPRQRYPIGGGGNDTLIGGVGDDTLDGGAGDDTALFSQSFDK